MVRRCLPRLLVLLLLGLALSWPLLGSAVGEDGTMVEVAAAPDDGCAHCGGCPGGGRAGDQDCPTSVCPVAAAILAAVLPEPYAPPAAFGKSTGRPGQGRLPEVEAPPPRPICVA